MKHWEAHPVPLESCFGCKALTIQMNAGDARIADSGTTNKKWNKELEAYQNARAQGIQPAGTTTAAIQESIRASETLGVAYNANEMPSTSRITKETASVMKETGII